MQVCAADISQSASSLSRFAEKSFGCVRPPNGVVIEMEDPRCKIVAIEMDEFRCRNSLKGVVIGIECVRCSSLIDQVVLEVEDARCNRMAIKMEDPRCKSLLMAW